MLGVIPTVRTYTQGRRQVCKSGGAGMLLSADILPQNTMYSNIRYDEPASKTGPLIFMRVCSSECILHYLHVTAAQFSSLLPSISVGLSVGLHRN